MQDKETIQEDGFRFLKVERVWRSQQVGRLILLCARTKWRGFSPFGMERCAHSASTQGWLPWPALASLDRKTVYRTPETTII